MTRARKGRREKKRRKVPVSQKERTMGILNEMFVHTFGFGSVVGFPLVCVPDRVPLAA